MYDAVRNQYVPKYIEMNRNVTQVADNETLLMTHFRPTLNKTLRVTGALWLVFTTSLGKFL
jgi:hypothetical protein